MIKGNYRLLFKELIKSYYEDVFEEKIDEILEKKEIDKDLFAKVVSSLCGVEVEYSEDFSTDLKKAIENYRSSNRVVISSNNCNMDCVKVNGKTLCQNACPFDAIILNGNKSTINIDNCVDCGICVDVCDSNNFIDKVEFMPLFKILRENRKVIAVVAPAIVGQFGEDITMGQLRAGLKVLGFADMVEVAFFADMLTIRESIEFNRHIQENNDFVLSSCCCPIWVAMIKKQYRDLIKHITPSVSPMIAAGRVIKKIYPECYVVFIGPCVAKKSEAKLEDLKGSIDFVLTFSELKDIFSALNMKLEGYHEELSTQYTTKGGRIYGRVGGVSWAVKDAVKHLFPEKVEYFTSKQASGIEECKLLLEKISNRKSDVSFLEGMGCHGGCVGGPKTIISADKGNVAVNDYGEDSKIQISIDNKIMKGFLNALDIGEIEDFIDNYKVNIFERKME